MSTGVLSIVNVGGTDTPLFLLGVAFVVSGMVLRVKFGHQATEAEERAKDGWLNEEQARRRIAVMRYAGPVMIMLGTAAFVVLFWR